MRWCFKRVRPKPFAEHGHGQIVRCYLANEDHAAPSLTWDVYVMAGNLAVHSEGPSADSANVNKKSMFISPDRMAFESKGLVWI